MRSQHGPLASAALTALPTSRVLRIDPQPFRLLLCRRLHLPLSLSHRTCRCGRQLDVFGHHRAACPEAGVLGKRGFPLERAAAQVCKEAGARVSTNMFVRDMDLAAFNALDGRRLEIVADGLSLWQGAQLAIDTTMVLSGGMERPGQELQTTTVPLWMWRVEGRKPPTQSSRERGAAHVWWCLPPKWGRGGTPRRLSSSQHWPKHGPRKSRCCCKAEAAWVRRWSAILAFTAARALSMSLLDYRPAGGSEGAIPSVHEVMRDSRFQ